MKKKSEVEEFSFVEIDKHRLDREWIQQEKMVGYYGEKLADAKQRADIAKVALEVRQAELGKKIRSHPEKYGIDKVTEAAINQELIILMDEDATQVEHLEARHEVNILQAAINRLSDRSKAISDLIFLHSIGYFAAPKIPRGMKQEDINNMKDDAMREQTRKRRRHY